MYGEIEKLNMLSYEDKKKNFNNLWNDIEKYVGEFEDKKT